MAGMTENNGRRLHLLPAIVVTLLALVFGYETSVGPAALIRSRSPQGSQTRQAIDKFYGPLNNLPESLLAPLVKWGELWGGSDDR